MSEKRKKALVVYLAALFGIAFIIVSISLGIQIRQGNTVSTTAAERVEAMQNQMHNLNEENDLLKKQVKGLETTIDEIMEGMEFLEGNAYAATAKIEELTYRLEAYEYLVDVQQALQNGDREALLANLEKLEPLSEFLSEEDTEIYNTILQQSVTDE